MGVAPTVATGNARLPLTAGFRDLPPGVLTHMAGFVSPGTVYALARLSNVERRLLTEEAAENALEAADGARADLDAARAAGNPVDVDNAEMNMMMAGLFLQLALNRDAQRGNDSKTS